MDYCKQAYFCVYSWSNQLIWISFFLSCQREDINKRMNLFLYPSPIPAPFVYITYNAIVNRLGAHHSIYFSLSLSVHVLFIKSIKKNCRNCKKYLLGMFIFSPLLEKHPKSQFSIEEDTQTTILLATSREHSLTLYDWPPV